MRLYYTYYHYSYKIVWRWCNGKKSYVLDFKLSTLPDVSTIRANVSIIYDPIIAWNHFLLILLSFIFDKAFWRNDF
jgi:hypothetical protein